MIKLLFIIFFYGVFFHSSQAGEIYKWLDIEGIKQFSNKPPPVSCKTPSCIKLRKKVSRNLQRKKDVEIAQHEAEAYKKKLQEKEAAENKRTQQLKVIKLSPEEPPEAVFLDRSTILCVSFNNIREYKQVRQARKYLESDQHCIKTSEETEYTIIDKQDEFSAIRIYLKDGSSEEKWVETNYLVE
jgi:hypothetical protein